MHTPASCPMPHSQYRAEGALEVRQLALPLTRILRFMGFLLSPFQGFFFLLTWSGGSFHSPPATIPHPSGALKRCVRGQKAPEARRKIARGERSEPRVKGK